MQIIRPRKELKALGVRGKKGIVKGERSVGKKPE